MALANKTISTDIVIGSDGRPVNWNFDTVTVKAGVTIRILSMFDLTCSILVLDSSESNDPVTIEITGKDGLPGVAGAPGKDGAPGGAGGTMPDVNLMATSSIIGYGPILLTARGGLGGNGGNGGDGGDSAGGNGGNGGNGGDGGLITVRSLNLDPTIHVQVVSKYAEGGRSGEGGTGNPSGERQDDGQQGKATKFLVLPA